MGTIKTALAWAASFALAVPLARAAAPCPINAEAAMDALRDVAYAFYDTPSPIDAANDGHISKVVQRFADACGGMVTPADVRGAFDADHPDVQQAAWLRVRAALSAGDGRTGAPQLFLDASVQPSPADPDDRQIVSVIGGVLQSRRRVTRVADGRDAVFDEVVISGHGIRSAAARFGGATAADGLPTSTIIVFSEDRLSGTDSWLQFQALAKQWGMPAVRAQVVAAYNAANGRDFNPVSRLLVAAALVDRRPDQVEDLWTNQAEAVSIGRLALRADADFQFCLRHSALSPRERADVCDWYAYLAAVRFGGDPRIALGAIARLDDPDRPAGPSVDRGLRQNLVETQMTGAAAFLETGDSCADVTHEMVVHLMSGQVRPRKPGVGLATLFTQQRAVMLSSLLDIGGGRGITLYHPDSDRALAILARARLDAPTSVKLQLLEGEFDLSLGKEQAGLDLIKGVIRQDRMAFVAARVLALYDLAHGRSTEAVDLLRLADGKTPNDPNMLYLLWSAWNAAGRPAEAAGAAQRFLSLEPTGKRADKVRAS